MAGIEAISALIPSITSGSIFAPRRVNKGAESDNALVAAMNFGIAGGQAGNVFRGVAGVAKASTGDLAAKIVKFDNAINNMSKELSNSDKVMSSLINGSSCVMRNINTAIGITELAKIAFAEDKLDATLTGGGAFGAMLLGEGATKRILGLSKATYNNGTYQITSRTPLYHKFINKKHIDAIKDYLVTNKFVSEKVMKHLPSVTKGILFALASILSYQAGRQIGKTISNKIKNNENKNTKKQDKDVKQAA